MSSKQSPELTAFYQEYYHWATTTKTFDDEKDVFWRACGLCTNFKFWAWDMGAEPALVTPFLEEMRQQFVDAGIFNFGYPFDKSYIEHNQEVMNDLCYRNPKRLQWCKDHS